MNDLEDLSNELEDLCRSCDCHNSPTPAKDLTKLFLQLPNHVVNRVYHYLEPSDLENLLTIFSETRLWFRHENPIFQNSRNFTKLLQLNSTSAWSKFTFTKDHIESLIEFDPFKFVPVRYDIDNTNVKFPKIFYLAKLLLENLPATVRDQLQITLDFEGLDAKIFRRYFDIFDHEQLIQQAADVLGMICDRVTTIDLSQSHFDDFFLSVNGPVFFKFLSTHRNCTKLDITQCEYLNQVEISYLRTFTDLKYLVAGNAHSINELFVGDLTTENILEQNLEQVTLQKMGDLPVFVRDRVAEFQSRPQQIELRAAAKFNLTHLSLLECYNLTSNAINKICSAFPDLKSLYIDGENLQPINGKFIAKLPLLTTLQILHINDDITEEQASQFLTHFLHPDNHQKFENLKLTQGKLGETPIGRTVLLNFVKNKLSTRCRVLDLTDAGVTNDTLIQIFKVCGHSLEILVLNWNDKLSDESFKFLTDNFREIQLKRLSLAGNKRYQATHGEHPWFHERSLKEVFTRLKYIAFPYCDLVDDEKIKNLKSWRPALEIIDYYNDSVVCCGENCCEGDARGN